SASGRYGVVGPAHCHRVSTPAPEAPFSAPAAGEPVSSKADPTDRSDQSVLPGEEEALTWSVHLATQRPERAVIITAATVAVGWLAWQLFRNPAMTAFSIEVLFAATADFLFPIRY